MRFGIFLLALGLAFSFSLAAPKAPKSAAEYYSDAAFQYIENRLPTAEITCSEGLSHYPDDAKLQMLKDRIEESKDEQQKQNRENNPNGENQEQKDQDDSGQDNQNGQGQDSEKNPERDSGSSNGSNDAGNSSASENSDGMSSVSGENSSDSQGGQNASDSGSEASSASEESAAPEEQPGQMSKQEASQLLKDFDEEQGERKPWKPARGMSRPEKDW